MGGVQDLAKAYGECLMMTLDQQFFEKLKLNIDTQMLTLKADTPVLFTLLYRLSALTKISDDIGTWYEHGYFSPD